MLCIAFCCCLYYIHTALCSCTAYRKRFSDWSCVSHMSTWFFLSLILHASKQFYYYYYTVTPHSPFDPFLVVFLQGVWDCDLQYVFLHPLNFFFPVTFFNSKLIQTSNFIYLLHRNFIFAVCTYVWCVLKFCCFLSHLYSLSNQLTIPVQHSPS